MYTVSIEGRFSSAHYLREYNGKCENVHGHNYRVIIEVSGTELDKTGLLVDFHVLRGKLNEVLDGLDHRVLNDAADFFKTNNPSAENIAAYVFQALDRRIDRKNTRLRSVTVYETEKAYCRYERE